MDEICLPSSIARKDWLQRIVSAQNNEAFLTLLLTRFRNVKYLKIDELG